MKTRMLIGLLVVMVLSVSQVSAQDSAPATACCSASGQKAAAASCSTSADAAPAKLTSVDGQATACCSGAAPAKLASATPGCPMEAAGIQLTQLQQAKIQAVLAQARKDLLAVLNVEQQAKFAKFAKVSQVSLMPLVFAQKASITSNVAAGTQSCCAAKTVAQTMAQTTTCSGDCQKACCAATTVAQTTTCPADCQKACCAAKTTTVAEQTTCPIMKSSPIKKTVFTVYQGKKVYFCCAGCDKEFNKNPEKYTKNLPQFGQ
jgi:YHS domain-containing protein